MQFALFCGFFPQHYVCEIHPNCVSLKNIHSHCCIVLHTLNIHWFALLLTNTCIVSTLEFLRIVLLRNSCECLLLNICTHFCWVSTHMALLQIESFHEICRGFFSKVCCTIYTPRSSSQEFPLFLILISTSWVLSFSFQPLWWESICAAQWFCLYCFVD